MWFLVLGEVMLRILEVKKHGARVSWERPQFSLTGYPAFSLSLLTCNLCNLSHEAFSGSPFYFPLQKHLSIPVNTWNCVLLLCVRE